MSESFQLGQHVSSSKLIDDKTVRRDDDLIGDHDPIHMDGAFAKKTKFGHRPGP